jgi:protein involved in sex pheromone biosynthesis
VLCSKGQEAKNRDAIDKEKQKRERERVGISDKLISEDFYSDLVRSGAERRRGGGLCLE